MLQHAPTTSLPPEVVDHPVVLFDGKCNLCNGSVNFILDRERGSDLRFASLQGEVGAAMLDHEGMDRSELGTMLFVEDGRVYRKSSAVLRITRYLKFPWNLARWCLIVPRPVRDFFYGIVARNRYRWFGSTDACRLATPDLKARFLDESQA